MLPDIEGGAKAKGEGCEDPTETEDVEKFGENCGVAQLSLR